MFHGNLLGSSRISISINYMKTRASREMTLRKNIKIFDFNGVNVFRILCLCVYVCICVYFVDI